MTTSAKGPFDVKLSEEKRAELTRTLCDAIRIGLQARSSVIQEGGAIDFAYALYEQQSQKGIGEDYGGMDLTSPIGTQMVDTLTAIASKTVFQEPFLLVDGFGQDMEKAPVVEEHMQWRIEDMRGQSTCTLGISASFIEEGAILEVCEDAAEINRQEVVRAALAVSPEDGTYLMDSATGKAMPAYDDAGELVPAQDGQEFCEVHRKYVDTMRRGATLRLHSLKDFLFLPGHARDRRDVWGHAVRFWMTLDELKQGAEYGKYDDLEQKLGTAQEREQRTESDRTGTNVDVVSGSGKVEKELWRIQFYADLGDGMCFYIATLSLEHECLLRVKHDWLSRWRTVYLNPYPRTYSVYGYSLILHKLLTTIEGHTAFRNMNAYRATLNANKPKWRLAGAQWHPDIQPWGAGETIDVTRPDEVGVFPEDEVTQHAFAREREFYEEAARIVGVSDILASVNPKVSRTLGENEMVTEQSFSRVESPVTNLQEAFEEMAEVIHAIEVKTLEESETGMLTPGSVASGIGLAMEDESFTGMVTAEMIRGRFRFKPHGSVDSADPNRRINNLMSLVGMMERMAAFNPALGQRYTGPDIAEAMNRELVAVAKPRDKKAFLAPLPPPMPMGMPGMPMDPAMAAVPGAPMPGGAAPNFGGEELVQQMLGQVQP